MLLAEGEKIFVAHRRLFERDGLRFFVGRVDACESGIVRATGHSYVRDNVTGGMLEKPDERTRLFALVSGSLLFYVLPASVELSELRFVEDDGRLSLLDNRGFSLNLSDTNRGGHI